MALKHQAFVVIIIVKNVLIHPQIVLVAPPKCIWIIKLEFVFQIAVLNNIFILIL